MIDITEYLSGKAAREAVRALLADLPARQLSQLHRGHPRVKPEGEASVRLDDRTLLSARKAQAWTRIGIARRWDNELGWDKMTACYYRANGDCFDVVDMGRGARALRFRTGICADEASVRVSDIAPRDGDPFSFDCDICAFPTADELPGAICKVLLASYQVGLSSEPCKHQRRKLGPSIKVSESGAGVQTVICEDCGRYSTGTLGTFWEPGPPPTERIQP